MSEINFTVRQLRVDEWSLYKRIRLEGLSKNPEAFSPSRNESEFTDSDWQARLSHSDGSIFGLFADIEIVGLTAVVRDKKNPTVAHLTQSYIQQPFRDKGLSKLLYQERIYWARDQGDIELLTLDVNEDNLASQNACKNFGFIQSDSYLDQTQKVMVYTLALK